MTDQTESPRRTSGTARGSNRGRLVEVLRRHGPLPRVELARSTGLSFPAVSGLTSRLIAEELLCETETAATPWSDDPDEEDPDGLNGRRRGRPAVLLTLNPEFGRIIAVSLRMNLIETLIADFSGFSLAQSRLEIATRALDAGALCDLVITQINAMLEATATPRHRLLGIGIALQGIVNADTGRHLWSPALPATSATARACRTNQGGGSRESRREAASTRPGTVIASMVPDGQAAARADLGRRAQRVGPGARHGDRAQEGGRRDGRGGRGGRASAALARPSPWPVVGDVGVPRRDGRPRRGPSSRSASNPTTTEPSRSVRKTRAPGRGEPVEGRLRRVTVRIARPRPRRPRPPGGRRRRTPGSSPSCCRGGRP